MNPYLLLAAFAWLVGCTQPVRTETIEVKMPVSVPCIATPPAKPTLTLDTDLIAMSDKCVAGDENACYRYVTDMHVNRLRLKAYQLEADALMSGCVRQF